MMERMAAMVMVCMVRQMMVMVARVAVGMMVKRMGILAMESARASHCLRASATPA